MSEGITYKTPEQMRLMTAAGQVVADMHDAVRAAIAPGVTTAELNRVAADVCRQAGATPSFLGYHGFTGVLCTSINEEIVHGIPGERRIEPGDVVSIDAGAILDGWHGDAAFTVVVDPADEADVHLNDTTQHAMWAAIAALATGKRLAVVGEAVERTVRKSGVKYGIIREYVGHGIGQQMHEAPQVPNYRGRDLGAHIKPGMVVAIEPMLVHGRRSTRVLGDGWTVITADRSRAAHWEHTVAIHAGGIWVTTARDGGAAGLAAHGVVPVAP